MATSYAQLQKQIEALQSQAAKVKSVEVAGVVKRIRDSVAMYGLTPQDIFGSRAVTPRAKAIGKKGGGKGDAVAAAKYVDGKGGIWGGRGKRPRWLQEALAAGRKLEDYLAGAIKAAVEPTPETALAAAVEGAPKKSAYNRKAPVAAKKTKGKLRAM